MESLSCFCSNESEHFPLGVVEYSTLTTNVDDFFDESDFERSDAESPSVVNPSDMDAILSCTSNVTLNIDDPDDLIDDSVFHINPKDLFPKNEGRLKKERKLNEKN